MLMATTTLSIERALERFAAKCRFDARTGCVLWVGGTTTAQASEAKYGSFWFEGRRWCAHRWAAKYIHGQEIEGLQVDHCCPPSPINRLPNTLCVQHLQSVTQLENLQLRWGRIKWGWDNLEDFTGPGYEGPETEADMIPWHMEPDWFIPFTKWAQGPECPF